MIGKFTYAAQVNTVMPHKAELLLGIKFDDKLFVEVEIDIVTSRKCYYLCGSCFLVYLKPLGEGCLLKSLDKTLDLLGGTACALTAITSPALTV